MVCLWVLTVFGIVWFGFGLLVGCGYDVGFGCWWVALVVCVVCYWWICVFVFVWVGGLG